MVHEMVVGIQVGLQGRRRKTDRHFEVLTRVHIEKTIDPFQDERMFRRSDQTRGFDDRNGAVNIHVTRVEKGLKDVVTSVDDPIKGLSCDHSGVHVYSSVPFQKHQSYVVRAHGWTKGQGWVQTRVVCVHVSVQRAIRDQKYFERVRRPAAPIPPIVQTQLDHLGKWFPIPKHPNGNVLRNRRHRVIGRKVVKLHTTTLRFSASRSINSIQHTH